jgi:hypothetical protein
VVAALVTSASGAVHSSTPDSTSARPTWEYPGGKPERVWYQRMNRLTEELRQELNATNPDLAVVADRKAQLRLLANHRAR